MTTTYPAAEQQRQAYGLFEQLSDEQLISLAMHHADKFNQAWLTVMRKHYTTAAHIAAQDVLDREYQVLGQVCRYARQYRPAGLYEDLCKAANWKG